MTPGDHALQGILAPFENGFNPAICTVPHPSPDALHLCLLACMGAVVHPLHPAGYDHMRAFFCHCSFTPI